MSLLAGPSSVYKMFYFLINVETKSVKSKKYIFLYCVTKINLHKLWLMFELFANSNNTEGRDS